jgi:hypothetical protein
MGCDIHMAIEIRDPKTGTWSWLHGAAPCGWCQDGRNRFPNRLTGERETCYWCKGTQRVDGYDQRNYDLFGILANVRFVLGFGGIDTGDSWPTIADNRGLPLDMSPELARSYQAARAGEDEEGYDRATSGDHSFTCLSLAEALAYPWDDIVRAQRGMIGLAQYARWDRKTSPSSYCVDVGGGGVTIMAAQQADSWLQANQEEAARLLAQAEEPPFSGSDHRYVRIEWNETARQAAGPGWFRFLDGLQANLPGGTHPIDVRFVLGFDS